MEDTLELYRKLKKHGSEFKTACALLVYYSIDCHINEGDLTNLQYKMLADIIFGAYMIDDSYKDIVNIADRICELLFVEKKYTIEDLLNMNKRDILIL